MTLSLLVAMVSIGSAADPKTLRAGLDAEAGWTEVGRERFDDVGEVVEAA